MKFLTIVDEETNDVVLQIGEGEDGSIEGVCAEGYTVIVDGEKISGEEYKEEDVLEHSSALPCTCGAEAKDLDIVRTLTSYVSNGNLADVEIEYKVVCPKCGREGDLAPNKNGAVLSWNEKAIKETLQ
jgi:hypothetical protein